MQVATRILSVRGVYMLAYSVYANFTYEKEEGKKHFPDHFLLNPVWDTPLFTSRRFWHKHW